MRPEEYDFQMQQEAEEALRFSQLAEQEEFEYFIHNLNCQKQFLTDKINDLVNQIEKCREQIKQLEDKITLYKH